MLALGQHKRVKTRSVAIGGLPAPLSSAVEKGNVKARIVRLDFRCFGSISVGAWECTPWVHKCVLYAEILRILVSALRQRGRRDGKEG